jgi:hypothetical protein
MNAFSRIGALTATCEHEIGLRLERRVFYRHRIIKDHHRATIGALTCDLSAGDLFS